MRSRHIVLLFYPKTYECLSFIVIRIIRFWKLWSLQQRLLPVAKVLRTFFRTVHGEPLRVFFTVSFFPCLRFGVRTEEKGGRAAWSVGNRYKIKEEETVQVLTVLRSQCFRRLWFLWCSFCRARCFISLRTFISSCTSGTAERVGNNFTSAWCIAVD